MIRKTKPQDVAHVAAYLRPEDEQEVRSLTGLSPLQALTIGAIHSPDCITGFTPEGEPAVIAGVVPMGDGTGSVWMLCTPAIKGNVRELVATARLWVAAMLHKYGTLTNVVDARNTVHLRFVSHLGFELGAPIAEYGPGRVSVLPITRGTDV